MSTPRCLLTVLFLMVASVAFADGGGHEDPVASVVLGLAIVLVAGKLGAELAVRLGHAAVLGELAAGLVIGNLDALGVRVLEPLASDASLDMLSRLGVLVLLFQVGLESTVRDMLRVGVTSFLVALVGVAVPFGLGFLVSRALAPASAVHTHIFVGATLTATSVGITARVFKDLDVAQTDAARIVLGAAVIDDVLGLVVLAVVVGMVEAAAAGTALSAADVALTTVKASAFLVGALAIGIYLAPRALRVAARLRAHGVLLTVSLAFAFVLSWAASRMGLAAIVGAFAAGLVLEDVHYEDFRQRGERGLEVLVEPIAAFLVPVFFVVMGMRTDLPSLFRGDALLLSLALAAVAVVGKLASGLGALGRPVDRWLVGLGMIPRGEVGLIFAGVGRELRLHGEPVLTDAVFSALILVVVVSTLITPPLLGLRIRRTTVPAR